MSSMVICLGPVCRQTFDSYDPNLAQAYTDTRGHAETREPGNQQTTWAHGTFGATALKYAQHWTKQTPLRAAFVKHVPGVSVCILELVSWFCCYMGISCQCHCERRWPKTWGILAAAATSVAREYRASHYWLYFNSRLVAVSTLEVGLLNCLMMGKVKGWLLYVARTGMGHGGTSTLGTRK